MGPARAVARRTFADSRVRNVSFTLLLGLLAYVNVIGYRHSYPTREDRLSFARTFGANKAVQLFYGVPHDLLSVGGYTAWRVGGSASILAAVWGLLAAVRALRTEEESGRQELVLAGELSRRDAYLAALAAIAAGGALVWLGLFAGLTLGRLPPGASAYIALAVVAPIPVFAGIGALASQLASTRRLALGLASGALVVAFALRVVADTANGLGWARWATPLGWVQELRASADPDPVVLLLPALTGALLLIAAGLISTRRDVGTGLVQGRDRVEPRLRLLSSPSALALRSELGTLAAWLVGTGGFALLVGILSASFTKENLPANLQEEVRKIGGASLTSPAGALGFYFLLFALAISLFACSQVAAARREEADEQLETLFALPVDRRRWLVGRLALAVAGATAIGLSAGLLAWIGAATQHAGVSLPQMLEAGANCLPAALLFLGLTALAFALVPRASAAVGYGLVGVTFLWQLFGSLVGAPRWLLDATPFRHIGLVPAQAFRAGAAAVMLGLAGAAAVAALAAFRRRDLAGG